ncbi:MAG: hypothetical protein CME70_03790 [Halobacteriovorax sp.]|nr:hypothetical protein [Halobacteriovorax sp.]|tara:strand:+ start:161849 stop:168265 length:6417 start_codon:yes stop_codon:yes gene_type:complete
MLRLKTSKFIFLLGALLLASLNSCGGKREKKKENSLTVLSAAIGDLNSVLPGGLMIYAHEASKDLAYTYHAYNGHSTLELENGTWTFWAVGWKGGSKMTGPVRCGKTSMNLEGGDGTLALLMNDSRCDDVDFAASIYRASSQFKALRITSCNSLASVTAGTDNCSGVVGPAGSYKIKLPQLDGPDSTASNATSTGLEVCIADGATGNGNTSTSLLLPTGGSSIATSLFTTIIEVHTNSTCTALGDSYTFANGIASAVTNQSASDVKIFSDTTEVSLYLKPSSVSVTQPTVTLTTTESSFHNSSPYTVSASFSENVSGVALGDFTVVSGSAGNLVQYTSASYSVDITPTAGPATSVTVTFNAGGALAISDSDPNLVSNSLINTYDNVAPTASSVSIYSSNSTSTLAKVGDIVTLSFTLSETLTGSPTVTIDGNSATIGGSHPTYTATYTLQAGDTEGVLGFTLDFTDAAGNTATQVTAVTDGSSVVFDETAPTASFVGILSNNLNTSRAKVGDVVTVSFTVNEALTGSPTVTIDGNAATIGGTHPNYQATYTMQSGDTEASLGFTLDFTDAVGNSATQVTAVTNASSVTFDEAAPSTTFRSIVSNNATTTMARVGDVVTLSFTVNEALLGSPTVTIDGNATSIANAHPNYQATYTMQAGDTEGVLSFTLDFTDASGNAGTQQTTVTDGSSVTFDETAASVSQVRSTKANGTYGLGQVIDVLVEFSELVDVTGTPQITLETGGADAVVNYSSGTGSNTLTFQYTVGSGEANADLDYVATNSLVLNGGTINDLADNAAILTLATPNAVNSISDNQNIVIETTAPSVSTINRGSTPAVNPTGATSVEFDVTFSEAVGSVIAGDFTVTNTGTGSPSVSGVSGGPTTWTVTVDTTGVDGDIGLDLSDANNSIADTATNVISPNTHTSDQTWTVDSSGPTVSEVNSTKGDGSYKSSEVIDIRVIFNEAVIVTGSPQITLDFSTDYAVNYSSGSGTDTLTFQYTVVGGQDSADLDYAATNSLVLNAGTIQDATGNNATLTLASPGAANSISDNQAIVIDNTAPTISTINRTNTSPTNGNSVDFTVTFDESVATVVAGDFSVSLSGSGSPSVSGVAGSGATRTVTVNTTSTDGTVGLDLADLNSTIQDAAGNVLSSNTHTSDETYTVDQTNPTASPVTISSNNIDTTKAKVGDTVTVSFTVNEALLGSPTVTIDGNAATISGGPLVWTGSYTMQAGDTEGTLGFTVDFQDSAGNNASQITATTDASAVIFDETAPTASPVTIASNNSFNTDAAKVGDIVTLNFTVSETLLANPVVTIDGNAATIGGTAPNYNATYTMQAGDSEAILTFTIDFNDAAGNSSTQITATTDVSTVTFDETNPTAPTLGTATGYYGAAFNTSFTASTDTNFSEYRYRLDGTVPTDCSNGTGTPGTTVNIPVKTVNNTTQGLRVIACDDAGNQSTSVARTYTWLEPTHLKFYTNTADWNDWINNSSPGTRGAALCAGSGDCIHGAQYLEVDVPELSSCTGLTATDANDVFIWECDDTGNVKFTNHRGFKDGKGLGDLLDATAWKSFYVDISGGSLLSTVRSKPNITLWGNTVSALPGSTTDGTMQDLTTAGNLYTYSTNATIDAAYNITADKIGIVNIGGDGTKLEISTGATSNHCNATLALPGAKNSKCMVVAKNRKYVWVEGEFDGRNTQLAVHMIYFHTTNYSTIHNSKVYDSGETGINFNAAGNNKVSDVEVYEHEVGGSASIYLQGGSNDNKFYKWDAYEGNVGLWITGSSVRNNFKSFRVSHHQDTGIYVDASNQNKFQDGVITGTDNTATVGLGFHTFSGSQDTVVVGLTSFNNFIATNIDSGSGNIMLNTTLANGSDTADGGLLVDGTSTNNSFLRLVSVNSAGKGVKYDYSGSNTNNAQYDLSLASNAINGIQLTGAGAHQDSFQGILDFQGNGTDCNGGGTKGLSNSCTDTTGGSNIFTYDSASGLTGASSFVGKGATSSYAALNGTNAWINGFNLFQGYGEDGTGFGNRGPCETGDTCAVYDWALQSSDTVLKGLFSAPPSTNSASDNITHIFTGSGSQSILRYAVEVNPLDYHTFSGDQDGLCENGEVCVINPNIGAYQGHGTLVDTPADISSGTPFNNIKLLQWDTNGY